MEDIYVYSNEKNFRKWGLLTGIICAILFKSVLIGFSFLVLFWIIGVIWRHDESPILVFCLIFQWVFIIIGPLYKEITGNYPRLLVGNKINLAMLLSLLGLATLAMGIRTAFYLFRTRLNRRRKQIYNSSPYSISRLFWFVIVIYSIHWFIELFPRTISYNFAQIIYRFIEFRHIFFFLLLLVIIQQRKGYWYGLLGFLFVLVPSLINFHAIFVRLFSLLLVALLGEWYSRYMHRSSRKKHSHIILTVMIISIMVFILSIIWLGAVRSEWRYELLHKDLASETPIEKLKTLGTITTTSITDIDWISGLERLLWSVSSSLGYFSCVLERIPQNVPYEYGSLTLRAVKHVATPRFIFTDKQDLGGDSWLVQTYAGIPVSGEEQDTSIGLGYMAEFYIDFGIFGMFIPLYIYGLLIGGIYSLLFLASPSYNLFNSVTAVLFLQHFTSFSGEIAKLWGGMTQAFVVYWVVMIVIGQQLHRNLSTNKLKKSVIVSK